MPDKFVFPGGRVDRADGRIRPLRDLSAHVARRLAHRSTPARARAIALAAIRETFEETGLLVGQPAPRPLRSRSPVWGAFLRAGIAPDLAPLELVARAVTPPGEPRRFDARFLMADASCIQGELHERPTGSGELLHLRWVDLEQARKLDLPRITRIVIDEVDKRLAVSAAEAARMPVPFYRYETNEPFLELVP